MREMQLKKRKENLGVLSRKPGRENSSIYFGFPQQTGQIDWHEIHTKGTVTMTTIK